MKFHPLAQIFPLLPESELLELAEDIRQNGLRGPITIHEGKILDGRNRFLACKKAKVEPKFREFTGENPLAFVISANLRRRHLTTAQRSMIAAKLATMREGRPSKTSSNDPVSVQQAADALRVSPASVKRARKILREAPEDADAIQRGEKTLSQAAATPKRKLQSPNGTILLDKTGYPIPKPALEVWSRSGEAEEFVDLVRKARNKAKELQHFNAIGKPDLLYIEVNMQEVVMDLSNVVRSLKNAIPYAVCSVCQGQLPKNCTLCKGRGVISQFRWHTVPEELKRIREASSKRALDKELGKAVPVGGDTAQMSDA